MEIRIVSWKTALIGEIVFDGLRLHMFLFYDPLAEILKCVI